MRGTYSDAENLPTGQRLHWSAQSASPTSVKLNAHLKVPAGHGVHSSAPNGGSVNLPAGHMVHESLPACCWYLFAGHARQCSSETMHAQVTPALRTKGCQCSSTIVLQRNWWHLLHSSCVFVPHESGWNCPGTHSRHRSCICGRLAYFGSGGAFGIGGG
jgi:hypothetical protein